MQEGRIGFVQQPGVCCVWVKDLLSDEAQLWTGKSIHVCLKKKSQPLAVGWFIAACCRSLLFLCANIYHHLDISYIMYHDPGSLWTLKRSPWRPKSCGAPKDREAFMTLLRTLQGRARMVPPGKGKLLVMWLQDTAQGARNGRKQHLLILHLECLCPLHHIMAENVEGSYY